MKTFALITAASALLTCSAAAQAESINADDRIAIIDRITDIASGADRHQWNRVRNAFADKVTLDYTSLWGGEPAIQSADDVIAQWSAFLPGFDETLHLVTNHAVITNTGQTVVAEADFQAAHRIGDDMWILMGHYRYDLAKIGGTWKVTRMVMTRTHEIGDRGLVDQAAQRARKGK